MESSFVSLLGVAALAFAVPFILGFFPRLRLPAVVAEVVVGIIVGPAVLGWLQPTELLDALAGLGVAFLLFLAGLELNLGSLAGEPARRGSLGFVTTFLLGLALTIPLGIAGWIISPLFVAVALSATSVGIIVPVLRDTGQLTTRPGLFAIAGGSVAEFATIAMLGIFFAREGSTTLIEIALMVALALLSIIALRLLHRLSRWEPGRRILDRLDESTSQPRVRFAVLAVIAAAAIALAFGFEAILGTFLAGILFGIVIRGDRYEKPLRLRLEALGYGFFVPIFFISSGLGFDAAGLDDALEWIHAGVFLAILLLIHAVPALILHRRALGVPTALAVGLLQATNLSFVVVAVGIGEEIGRVGQLNGSALIVAGLLSAVLFPVAAQTLLAHTPSAISHTRHAP